MRHIKLALLTFGSIIISTIFLSAQADKDYKLKITLVDSLTKNPVEFATISLTPEVGTQALKYSLSDAAGKAALSEIKRGAYLFKVEFIGYKTYSKNIVFADEKVIDLGTVYLNEKLNVLETVVVTAQGNPITVKKDTIEYNASSFKTTDSDMLEQLLKKLPGIEIDSDGKITANGKEIKKIMIDGKTFFFDDPQLATKNLPAKIIDKVKVLEKKSEQAQFTGIDDGNEETVIDLSIRPGMMNGWFGNLTAGYGTDDKYQGATMVGNFTSKNQISFIGNANNTNNRGFMDVAGSAMRSMRSSMGGGGGGVRIGGQIMNFGGSGLTDSWMAGVTGNTESANKKLKIGGSYLYNGSKTVSDENSFKQNFLVDSTFNYTQHSTSDDKTEGHSANLNLEYQISDKTSILFRPNVNIGYGSFYDTKVFSTEGTSGTKINNGNSISSGDNQSQSLNGDLLFRQKLNKVGRTFSLNVSYSYSNSDLDAINYSETNVFNGNNTTTSLVDQQYDLNNRSYSLGARASYTEPLGNNFFIETAYSYRYNQSNSDKNSYNKDILTGRYTDKDSAYSNSFKNTFINQQGEINLRKTGEKFNYVFGVNVQPSYTKSTGNEKDLSRSVVNFAPSAMLEYNPSDTRFLRVRYRGNVTQPTINQLQPVADNSNPLYIPLGNPDLLPEFAHRLSFDYRDTKKETFRTMNASLDANYTQNKIVNKTWYDKGGIQYTQPVNEQGVYSANGRFMFNTPVSRSKFYITTNSRLGFNKGVGYSNGVKNHTSSLSFSEMLRLTYRGEKLETGLGGSAQYSHAWYSIKQKTVPSYWTNSVDLYANWTLPSGFSLTSDFNYRFYIGYENGVNEPSAVWNAEASKLLFKNMGTLRLKVYDILKQTKNFSRTTTDNYIEDVQNNTLLKQYFMLSFTWRFGKFGDGKDGERRGGERRMGPGMGGMHFH
ncbi:MAG: outer membrane beta-barrel family protein [Bacteroidales bacterium]